MLRKAAQSGGTAGRAGKGTEERKSEDGEEMEKWSGVTKGADRQLAVGSKQKRDDRQVRVRRRERTGR